MTEESNLQYANRLFSTNNIKITFVDGTTWAVQTAIVALNYANYYSKVDSVTVKESLDEAKSEYNNSNETLVDWLQNNMDWEEIVEFTSHVRTKPERSYADMFRTSDWSVCK